MFKIPTLGPKKYKKRLKGKYTIYESIGNGNKQALPLLNH